MLKIQSVMSFTHGVKILQENDLFDGYVQPYPRLVVIAAPQFIGSLRVEEWILHYALGLVKYFQVVIFDPDIIQAEVSDCDTLFGRVNNLLFIARAKTSVDAGCFVKPNLG